MGVKLNLFNENLFVFLTVIFVGILIISIYMSISPEKSTPYNFSPFPKIAPTALPDPDRPTDNCFNNLTACDQNGQCSACSLDNYECKTVTEDQAKAKLFHINGINVPAGNWCLPKDLNPRPCNTYTGRYMWVYDPGYCGSVIPGQTQCWKCECLYPSLFGDPTTGCTTKLACQNDSPKSNSITQSDNNLVSTSCALSSLKNKTWDPTQNQDNSLFEYTPYDQDKNGNPWFTCACNAVEKGQYFAQLPGDPYNCHLEPCYKSLGYKESGLINCDTASNCGAPDSCSCSCDSPNVAMSPSGNFKGTCVLINESCGTFGYDKQSQKCNCPSPNWEQKCRNPNTGVNMDNSDLPICKLPENSLGSECIDPCSEATCQHGSYCISCGSDSWESTPFCGLPSCDPQNPDNCSADLSKQVHAVCDCTSAQGVPDAPFTGYSGPNCSFTCLPGGIKLKAKGWLGDHCKCFTCNCCCSQNFHKEKDMWGIAYEEVCSDGYPYPPNPPADPACLPAMDCQDRQKSCALSNC